MDPDTDNMFAGLKKKKKKTVQILDTDESEKAATGSAQPAVVDPVRPEEKSADLTLPDEEPLDFSDLKKVRNCRNSMVSCDPGSGVPRRQED